MYLGFLPYADEKRKSGSFEMLLDLGAGAGAFLAGNVWILVELKDGDGFELAPWMVDAGDDDELIIEEWDALEVFVDGWPFDEADVEAGVVDGHFDLVGVGDFKAQGNFWIMLLEVAEDVRRDVFTDGDAGADTQSSEDGVVELLHVFFQAGLHVAHFSGVLIEQFACFSEDDVAANAVEQTGAIVFFEHLDLEADGRLCEKQCLSGLGKAFLFHDHQKHTNTII